MKAKDRILRKCWDAMTADEQFDGFRELSDLAARLEKRTADPLPDCPWCNNVAGTGDFCDYCYGFKAGRAWAGKPTNADTEPGEKGPRTGPDNSEKQGGEPGSGG